MRSSKDAVAVVWQHYGPYHHARLAAFRAHVPEVRVWGVQLSDITTTYGWEPVKDVREEFFETLFQDRASETCPFWKVFARFRGFLLREKVGTVLLPSYWPLSSVALLAAARSCGARTVMMNESHAGTESAQGIKLVAKRILVRQFDGALVGGLPHARYFESLGLPRERIFTGYDAVDNTFFAGRASMARMRENEMRAQYQLPPRFILSLGRFVAKKNLGTLVRAYAEFVNMPRVECPPALVFVGSGEEENQLRELCRMQKVPVWDCNSAADSIARNPHAPGPIVCFYGFRQIEENPIFYAMADVFVLPSIREEWGLVVNEAMACGLPVIVSKTAGCAEDLVHEGDNGWTFDPENHQELAGVLGDIWSDKERTRRMGMRSSAIIKDWGCDNFGSNAARALETVGAGAGVGSRK